MVFLLCSWVTFSAIKYHTGLISIFLVFDSKYWEKLRSCSFAERYEVWAQRVLKKEVFLQLSFILKFLTPESAEFIFLSKFYGTAHFNSNFSNIQLQFL